MKTLKIICQNIVQLVKQTWLLPQIVVLAFKERRHQILMNENEVERLDRIRNPSKYVGR